mgnify:CR=1 FL=1
MDPKAITRIHDSFASQTMMQTLGAEVLHVSEGDVRIAAPILPGTRQQQGFGHAGLTFSIGDTAAGYAALSMMANWDLERLHRDLARLACPLTLIVATRDRMVSPRAARTVRRIVADATVIPLPGLGHLAHEEDAECVAQWITRQAAPDGGGGVENVQATWRSPTLFLLIWSSLEYRVFA